MEYCSTHNHEGGQSTGVERAFDPLEIIERQLCKLVRKGQRRVNGIRSSRVILRNQCGKMYGCRSQIEYSDLSGSLDHYWNGLNSGKHCSIGSQVIKKWELGSRLWTLIKYLKFVLVLLRRGGLYKTLAPEVGESVDVMCLSLWHYTV